MHPTFDEIPYERPSLASMRSATEAHLRDWRAAASPEAQAVVMLACDREEIDLWTSGSIANVRYQCDTRSEKNRAEREFFDENGPAFTELRHELLRAFVASRFRAELSRMLGPHCFSIWESALASYQHVIAEDRRAEARLCRRYTELTASVRLELEGRRLTLSQAAAYFGDPDRGTRLRAQRARFAAIGEHREELDSLYDELVALRDGMGRKLGHDGYVPLAYVSRRRDYTPSQLAAFRRQVRDVFVPLASRIRKRHASTLGVADYAYHDSFVRDRDGVPKPMGGQEWMLGRAAEMFRDLGPDFAEFWSVMRGRELMDLDAREGKAGGGFCTKLPAHRVPFVFANFNGTADDVDVFTHECGHAFQGWRSMATQPLVEYSSATADAAEINSMSLEMLCHPQMELFFGDDASRYRAGHLDSSILMIPYCAAVDEFQHEVHEAPGLSPDQRAELWRGLERAYLPERAYPGMPHAESGRFWQLQRHVYLYPFYYIDYALAQSCALQFWQRSGTDREGAMAAYRLLCELGGSKPFTALIAEAELQSPFAEGSLEHLADDLERVVAV